MDPTPEPQTQRITAPPAQPAVPIEVVGNVPAAGEPNLVVEKVIVAVHGIGDQFSYATIQTVVNQFCHYYDQPAAVSLGAFHTGTAALTISKPFPSDPFDKLAFAEVYWARIPRDLVEEKHTVEEAKKWARTIVARLRMRSLKTDQPERDFRLVNQVLGELIETIAVVERLSQLASKAGVFTFDLRKLLDDYLADVQVVTEFTAQRNQILTTFDEVLTRVRTGFPNADLHIVAHSEGTVVAFLALLKAFREPERPEWADKVRGFMTLGSPIDKHLVLWPELFGTDGPSVPPPAGKIDWRNYYDHGDPVGFDLQDARAWLVKHRWNGVFDFPSSKGHDYGFARYGFPGKAHVDYWNDEAVFGHFIAEVVKPPAPKKATPPGVPRDIKGRSLLSYAVPYTGVAALLAIGAFIVFKALAGAFEENDLSLGTIAKAVTGLAALLFGITVVARVPRLTRSPLWRSVAVLSGVVGAAIYLWSVREWALVRIEDEPIHGMAMVGLAGLILVLVFWFSARNPEWGAKPLIIVGAGAVAGTVAFHLLVAQGAGHEGPMWPVFIATIAFLYIWWLAALLFDLVFVWHLYIRNFQMLLRMDEVTGGARKVPPSRWNRSRRGKAGEGGK